MVVVDSLGKRAHFVLTHTTVTAEGTAQLFLKEVWMHHGTPLQVVSDRGPQFISEFMTELYHLLGIKIASSTAYHPRPMVKPNMSTKKWSSSCNHSQANVRTIRINFSLWVSLPITITSTRRRSKCPSWWTLVDIRGWVLN
jgi:hypothetical protein